MAPCKTMQGPGPSGCDGHSGVPYDTQSHVDAFAAHSGPVNEKQAVTKGR